jgi:hypothetical protein
MFHSLPGSYVMDEFSHSKVQPSIPQKLALAYSIKARSDQASEAGVKPSKEPIYQMMKYNEALAKAGMLLARATQRSVLGALEARYPMLRRTIRAKSHKSTDRFCSSSSASRIRPMSCRTPHYPTRSR